MAKLPADFCYQATGDRMTFSATIKTTHDIDALASAVLAFRECYPSHRTAEAGDFGLEETPPKSLKEKLIEAGICERIDDGQ